MTLRLDIDMTRARHKMIVGHLQTLMPGVSVQVLADAAAMGFGFTSAGSVLNGRVSLDHEHAFVGLLAVAGRPTPARPLYRATARTIFAEIADSMPTLTGAGIEYDEPIHIGGRLETLEEAAERISEGRRSLLDTQGADEQFLRALAYAGLLAKRPSINESVSSGGLKHDAERYASTYADGSPIGYSYVSNGAFIAAMVHAEFKFERPRGSKCVYFYISQTSLSTLEREKSTSLWGKWRCKA